MRLGLVNTKAVPSNCLVLGTLSKTTPSTRHDVYEIELRLGFLNTEAAVQVLSIVDSTLLFSQMASFILFINCLQRGN